MAGEQNIADRLAGLSFEDVAELSLQAYATLSVFALWELRDSLIMDEPVERFIKIAQMWVERRHSLSSIRLDNDLLMNSMAPSLRKEDLLFRISRMIPTPGRKKFYSKSKTAMMKFLMATHRKIQQTVILPILMGGGEGLPWDNVADRLTSITVLKLRLKKILEHSDFPIV